MLKKLLSFTIVVVLLHATNAATIIAFAHGAQAGQDDAKTQKLKANVAKYAGNKNKVSVKLNDGTKLKGYISQAGENSFTLVDSKSAQSRTLTFAEVTEVKRAGGLSVLAKVGIGVGIGVGALALLFAIGKSTCDGFGC